MKPRTMGRHFRESLKSLARNGWMTFASVSAVTVTLLLVGVFVVLMLNMNKIASDIEKDVEVRVLVEIGTEKPQIEEMKTKIEQIDGIASIDFSSKEDELRNLMEDMGEDFRLFEQDNPLYDVYIVKAENPVETKRIASEIKGLNM